MAGPPEWQGRIFFSQDPSACSPGEDDNIHTYNIGGPIYGTSFLKASINEQTSEEELLLEAYVGDDENLVLVNKFSLDEGGRDFPVVILDIIVIPDPIFLKENSQYNFAFCEGILNSGLEGKVPVKLVFTSENATEPFAEGRFTLDFDQDATSAKDTLENVIAMLKNHKQQTDVPEAGQTGSSSNQPDARLYNQQGGSNDGWVIFTRGGRRYVCGCLESRDTARWYLDGDRIVDQSNSSNSAKILSGSVKSNHHQVMYSSTSVYPKNASTGDGYRKEGRFLRPASTSIAYRDVTWVIENGFPMAVAAYLLGGFAR
eukprot:TRINITY_DN10826_c0_g1_i1.p1 TRINITY_DN10826_c0_g1~~TRINITY_DN10826_c0_g1_i1.p1  ORF type:complete len:315 (-),score=51.14 TRINITY_DN10826_c0_g1_i1:29-973(-)